MSSSVGRSRSQDVVLIFLDVAIASDACFLDANKIIASFVKRELKFLDLPRDEKSMSLFLRLAGFARSKSVHISRREP